MIRVVLYLLLAVVAAAAAVLSFSALEALALACGFAPQLAWLLPIVIDAGAAAGSVTWLSSPPGLAKMFGRRLAIVLLCSSVLGNAVAHLLEAYDWDAAWWVVVAVSACAPGILAATIHLAVVATQANTGRPEQPVEALDEDAEGDGPGVPEPVSTPLLDDHDVSVLWQTAPTVDSEPEPDRAQDLIANGVGRRRLPADSACPSTRPAVCWQGGSTAMEVPRDHRRPHQEH